MSDPARTLAPSRKSLLWLSLALLAVLTLVAIISRPLTPLDETRYVGVAWEMWLRGDFLVPYKNGAPYDHKPPLMMWLFQLGWALTGGVNEWWPRLVSPLASAASLFLTWGLARRLWPERPGMAGPAVLMLLGGMLWMIFSTMAMFDILMALCTLIGLHGIVIAADGQARRGFAVLGLAIGLGVLAKGPVILLQVLPAALLAPWWNRGLRWGRWLGGIVLAILLGAAIALAWAIPAGYAGGEEYRNAIFWGQTANRMVESFAHRRPIWWYLPLLPLMLFPWFLWTGLWRALVPYLRQRLDRGGRLCLAWSLPVLLAFSFISGKQPHYLLPIFPAFALLTARALDDVEQARGLWLPALLVFVLGGVMIAPDKLGIYLDEATVLAWPGVALMVAAVAIYVTGRRSAKPLVPLALLGVALASAIQLSVLRPQYDSYDMHPVALAVKQVQDGGNKVGHMGFYHNQYQFAGRLEQPLVQLEGLEAVRSWVAANPHDYVVLYTRDMHHLDGVPAVKAQRYRGGSATLMTTAAAQAFLARPQVVDELKW